MKQQIIYTKEYALIVSDEKPIEGQYFLFTPYNLVFKADSTEYGENAINTCGVEYVESFTDDRVFNVEYCKTVIAHLPLKEVHILKGVPLLPDFSPDDDVDKIAITEHEFNHKTVDEISFRLGFKEGYNKAKETYKYTEEDLREAFTAGLMNRYSRVGEAVAKTEFIQSLQQPKRPESILLETIGDSTMINKCKNFDIETGCIALRCTCENVSKPKTTTNLQGQIELVGSYIY